MADVLAADEIAQLFAAAKEGSLPEGPRKKAKRARSVRNIDFSRPMKLSLVEQRRFEAAHATFCREAGERLSVELHSSIELEVINASQITWQTALQDVPHPSILGVVGCGTGEAVILLGVEESLVLRMIERLLGGSFTDVVPPRIMTAIDLAISRHIFAGLVSTLSPVWEELLGLSVDLMDLEVHNVSVEYAQPSEPTLELTIEARDKGSSSTIMLLVPYNAIESANKKLVDSGPRFGETGVDDDTVENVRNALGAVEVEVRAEVGSVDLTMGEVLALSEGDIVPLGEAGEASITVADVRLHHAKPGLSGKHRAVQITGPTEDGHEH